MNGPSRRLVRTGLYSSTNSRNLIRQRAPDIELLAAVATATVAAARAAVAAAELEYSVTRFTGYATTVFSIPLSVSRSHSFLQGSAAADLR